MASLDEKIKRGKAAGLSGKDALRKWEIGSLQEMRGDVAAGIIDELLKKFTPKERAWMEAQIERLRGFEKPIRFRRQALIFLAKIYERAYLEGLKTGHRKEAARVHTKQP
jgi:hypothetical protein